jgi:alpha-beta hydrolase superfamily lysophospholipase
MERVEFRSGGQRVVGVLHPGRELKHRSHRIVITCHGILSSKDSQKYVQIAEDFTSHGISVLRFDFRGSGESEGEGNLLSNRVNDLESAITFVTSRGFDSFGLLGSSYGGTTAILVAKRNSRIGAIVTWSTPCELTRLFGSIGNESQESRAVKAGETEGRVISSGFMQDLSRHDVVAATREIGNILVIHCKGDEIVPWLEAKTIYNNARQPKQLKIFEGGDHQLLNPSIRRGAIDLSLEWMNKHL